jgi:hypothetical protein
MCGMGNIFQETGEWLKKSLIVVISISVKISILRLGQTLLLPEQLIVSKPT